MVIFIIVDSRHPNTSVTTAKADQLVTITTQAGNNFIVQCNLRIAARPDRATGWSARRKNL